MKRIISLFLIILMALSCFASCQIYNGRKDSPATNEELITARIETFLTAYNAGDMDAVLECLDAKNRNALKAMLNILGGLAGSVAGFGIDLSDLFSLGISTTSGDFMKLEITDITVIDSANATATTKMFLTGSGTQSICFEMVYENSDWYIHDMTDRKPADLNNNQDDSSNTGNSSDESETKLSYSLNYDGTAYSVSGIEVGANKSIVIPSTYEELPVISIKDRAFYNCNSLVNVTIPNSITSIGDNAFYGCTNLESITLPNSITTIGYGAFVNCANLSSVIIPDGVTSIENHTFNGCTKLTSVTVPASVTEIGIYAFENCYRLVEIINKSELNIVAGTSNYGNIGYYAIKVHTGDSEIINKNEFLFLSYRTNNYLIDYTGDDTAIVLPEKYDNENYKIYRNAFIANTTLTNVVIGNGVTHIDEKAFQNCTSLTSVSIGDSVETIGAYAFNGCSNLKSVALTKDSNLLKIENHSFENCSNLTNITIPNSVTSIGEAAFGGCASITSITIPNNVISIDSYAFAACSGLTIYCENITQPSDWHEFWNDWSFYSVDYTPVVWDCQNNEIANDGYVYIMSDNIRYALNENLATVARQPITNETSIIIPTSITYKNKVYNVTSIGNHAFSNNKSIITVTIPDSITTIEGYVFSGCTNLKEVIMSKNVTSLGYDTFGDCESLTNVYYSGTESDWNNLHISSYSGNYFLTGATRYYYSETEPTDMGNYWHYVDGVPTIWP